MANKFSSPTHRSTAPRRLYATVSFVVFCSLPSCATQPAYQPLHDPGTLERIFVVGSSGGYSDVPVRPDYYEVGYSSPTSNNTTVSRYYATVRAAEIALENDKPYFEPPPQNLWVPYGAM